MTVFSKLMARHCYEDQSLLLDFFAAQLRKGSLAVVLGAGASVGFSLPNWTTLVDRVLSDSGMTRPSGMLNTDAADVVLASPGMDEMKFAENVRRALYDGADTTLPTLRKNDLLTALGALAMGSNRGSVTKVISFNYDDLLERYLAFYGYSVESVARLPVWHAKKDVFVYHPHGLLPSVAAKLCTKIVFAQSHYDKVIGSAASEWRALMLDVMRSNTCLFIGLSGEDNNLKSIMTAVKDTHVSKEHSHLFWGFRFSDVADNTTIWETRGVKEVVVGNYVDLPDLLFQVCQRAAMLASESA